MEKEYDFSKAEQGKFYRPIEELDIPVYLDKKVKAFFVKKASQKGLQLEQMINDVLAKEMELLSILD
jgi:hypothetical protein